MGRKADGRTCYGNEYVQPGQRNRSKYGNRKVTLFGETFDSKLEAERWLVLRAAEKAGRISELKRQERFLLLPEQRIEGRVLRQTEYIADFTYYKNGKKVVEDTKGMLTDVYKLKRKLFAYQYGTLIKEVKDSAEDI